MDRALEAIGDRTYWSAYPEHPKAYGEDAPKIGQLGFDALLGVPFLVGADDTEFMEVAETSPYGIELGITYPRVTVDDAISNAVGVMQEWGRATPDARAGVCVEILDRLSKDSFMMGHAVMHTTGQRDRKSVV